MLSLCSLARTTLSKVCLLLASYGGLAALTGLAWCRRQRLYVDIALIGHHLAVTLRRLVCWRRRIGAIVCRRWRRVVLHLVAVGWGVLLVLCISCIWVAHVPLHHPFVVWQRWQAFTHASPSMPVAADEKQKYSSEQKSDYGVANCHPGLRWQLAQYQDLNTLRSTHRRPPPAPTSITIVITVVVVPVPIIPTTIIIAKRASSLPLPQSVSCSDHCHRMIRLGYAKRNTRYLRYAVGSPVAPVLLQSRAACPCYPSCTGLLVRRNEIRIGGK